jgi:hypothetical protein
MARYASTGRPATSRGRTLTRAEAPGEIEDEGDGQGAQHAADPGRGKEEPPGGSQPLRPDLARRGFAPGGLLDGPGRPG